MNDRKMIKWLPFDSVINSNQITNKINIKKERLPFPILSDDQLNENHNNLNIALTNKLIVTITFFKNYKHEKITTYIKKIDIYKKRIITNCNYSIDFNNVIKIELS